MVVVVNQSLYEPSLFADADSSFADNVAFDIAEVSTNQSTPEQINAVLKFIVPTLTAINIPLSLTNFFVFLKTGFLNSPSNMIYFNLVIVDLLNSVVGTKMSVTLLNDSDKSVSFWGDKKNDFERYVNNFTFDTNIVLVFGLCLIRTLWVEMSALQVLRRLRAVSMAIVILAHVYGMMSCGYRFYLEKQERLWLLFQSDVVEVKDIFECSLVISIICMSIYTSVRIWLKKSKVEFTMFIAAFRSSLIITVAVSLSYSFWIAIVATRVHYKDPWNNTFKCPGDKGESEKRDWSFTDFLLCDELYLSVTFMCFQSTVNSFILIFQRHTRRFLTANSWMCLVKVRDVFQDCFHEDSDYEYL
jgi:hypothetical protein